MSDDKMTTLEFELPDFLCELLKNDSNIYNISESEIVRVALARFYLSGGVMKTLLERDQIYECRTA